MWHCPHLTTARRCCSAVREQGLRYKAKALTSKVKDLTFKAKAKDLTFKAKDLGTRPRT